jgi:hypothetical protein
MLVLNYLKKDFIILEGHNRHEGLMRAMESLIARNMEILSLEQIKKISSDWNQIHCMSPFSAIVYSSELLAKFLIIAKVVNPFLASTNAISLPIPLDIPVTTTTCSFSIWYMRIIK